MNKVTPATPKAVANLEAAAAKGSDEYSKTDTLALHLYIAENCLDRPFTTMKRYARPPSSLPRTELTFWVGEQRRFHIRAWIQQSDAGAWTGALISIRGIGGGPDILFGHPERHRKTELPGPGLGDAIAALQAHATMFAEINARPHP